MGGNGGKYRNQLACNFCRLHRKGCTRTSPTAKCGFCTQTGHCCSKDRTRKELLEILERLLHSETEDLFRIPSLPTPLRLTNASLFNRTSSPSQFERPSTSAFSPRLPHEISNNPTEFEASPYDDDTLGSGVSPFAFNADNPSVDSANGPSETSTIADASQTALQLFEKLRAHQLTSESIGRHKEEVVQSVDAHCSLLVSLATLTALIERKCVETIDKIETLVYAADENNWVDQAKWIYGRLLQEVERTPTFPHRRKRALLLRMATFYQRLGAPLEEAFILDHVASLNKALSTSEEICGLRINALQNASRATGVIFAELPVQQVPLDFRTKGAPVPVVHHLLRHGSPRLVPKVLDNEARGAEPPVDLILANPLHVAAQDGDTAILRLLINKYRSGINGRDLLDRTPLFLAAWCGHDNACELLLDFQADINARSITNQTVIEIAARHGHINVMKVLCNRGADINPIPLEGSSTPLQAAAESGHLDVVRYLLDTRKADLIVRRFGDRKTAKDLASENGHAAIVGLLESAELSTQPNNDFFQQMQEFNEQMQL